MEDMVVKVLVQRGWKAAQQEAALARKDFAGREPLAYYYRGRLSFEFWSEGRNVLALAFSRPKTEQDVLKAVEYAERKIGESFYMRFLAPPSE